MGNIKSQRLHSQSHIEASELNLNPGSWPDTLRHQGNTFKRALKKVNINGQVVWCDYISNTIEQYYTLRVYND